LSGSRNKVETLGLESLFNTDVIEEFLSSEKNIKYEKLPKLCVELYFNEQDNHRLCGKVNSDGLMLICEPIDDLSDDIRDILNQDELSFPFEFYSIKFLTFSGEGYTGYKKFLKLMWSSKSAHFNVSHGNQVVSQ